MLLIPRFKPTVLLLITVWGLVCKDGHYQFVPFLYVQVHNGGKYWQQKKRASEDEMAGRPHWCMHTNLGKRQEAVRDRETWHSAGHRVRKCWTRLGDWITTVPGCQFLIKCSLFLHLPGFLAGLGFLWLLKYRRNHIMPGWGQIFRKTSVFCFLFLRTSPHALRCPSNYTDKSTWKRIKDFR